MRLLALAVLACSSNVKPERVVVPQPPTVVAEDPPPPTFRLPRHFVVTGYTAKLAIDPVAPDFRGEIAIEGALARPASTIWLHGKDLVVREAVAWRGSQQVALSITSKQNDLLEVRAAQPLAAGSWTLRIAYIGKIVTDEHVGAFRSDFGKDPYVLSQFQIEHARRVFPCLDEPDRKVPWQLTLEIPAGLVAVSNTPATRTTPVGKQTRIEFARTRPLPSYLIAFGVGPFTMIDAGKSKNGTPVRIAAPRGTESRAAYVASATPRLIDLLEDWFDTRFPYPKLDIIVAPSFGDAMENAGAILADPLFALVESDKPSWKSRHRIVQVIGHEIAHQWFGDLVTPAWWDDLWLNEAFATWMENYIGLWFEPAWHDDDQFVSVRNSALDADALTTARRIRQPVLEPGDLHNVADGITYQKGASVLRMIEQHVGPAVFQRGVRAFLQKHADGVASAADLIAAIEQAVGRPVKPIFDSFLDQAGAPQLTLTTACNGAPRIEVAQRRTVPVGSPPADDRSWTMPVCVVHERAGKRATTCATIDRTTRSIPLEQCPAWVMGNANGDGYYNVAVTTKDVDTLRDRAWPLLTSRERRIVLEDTRQRVLDGKVDVAALMSIWARLVASDDKLAVGDALGGTARQSRLLSMTGVPSGVDAMIPAARAEAVRARVRAVIGPRVARLGLLPRADDDFDRELLRTALVSAAARARDPALGREAVKLAAGYRTLAGSARPRVIQLAADHSPAFADRLYDEVLAESDSILRHEMLEAIATVRDPVRRGKAYDLALHPKLDISDQFALLFTFIDEPSRAAIETWIRTRWPELEKKLPPDGGIGRFLGSILALGCDRRTETAAFITKIGARVIGGEHAVKQQLELLDQCIAQRAVVGPSLDAWLSKSR